MYIYLVSHLFSHLVLTKGLSARGIHIGHILYNSPNHLGGKKNPWRAVFCPRAGGLTPLIWTKYLQIMVMDIFLRAERHNPLYLVSSTFKKARPDFAVL